MPRDQVRRPLQMSGPRVIGHRLQRLPDFWSCVPRATCRKVESGAYKAVFFRHTEFAVARTGCDYDRPTKDRVPVVQVDLVVTPAASGLKLLGVAGDRASAV